jgi:hypothetical protein
MADRTQIREITAKLESGVQELFESNKYAEYLRTMSRFHSYSTRNTLLIHLQMPTAVRVAGYLLNCFSMRPALYRCSLSLCSDETKERNRISHLS